MGRKPLSDARKYQSLRIMLSDSERAELDAGAVASGNPQTSTWARDVLLSAARAAVQEKKPKKKAT